MYAEFEELFVCYDTVTKKCICISRQESLIKRYINNNKIKNTDVFKVEGEDFIDKYESVYGSYELEEYGTNVVTCKEKMMLLDMVKEDAHMIKSVAMDLLRLIKELNLNDKERMKLAKAYTTLDSFLEPTTLRRVMDLDTLYKNSKIKDLIDVEREIRGEIDEEVNPDMPLIILI